MRSGIGALTVLSSCAVAVRAQDLPPGLLVSFDINQRLEYSNNPDLDVDGTSDLMGRTTLGFNLESVTGIQSLALNLGTDLEEFKRDNDQSFDIKNSFGTLNYTRATNSASIGTVLRYRESDVDGGDFDEDFDQDSSVITQTDGTRVSYGYTLSGAIGEEAPLGGSFDWRYNKINFEDTSDDSLDDSTLNAFSGQIDFRIDPRITLNLKGFYQDFDTDDPGGTDRKSRGLGLATELEVTPLMTINAGLSYDRIERTGGTNQNDNGISGEIELLREMPNGTLGLRYASEVFANTDGRRSFLSVSRNIDLPLGALDVSLGVTGSDAVGTDPLIEVDYRYDLPTAQLTFGLTQRVVVDDEDNEDNNTALRAAYNQEINNLSSFGINIDLFNSNVLGDDGGDSQRVDIQLNYSYDLTRDWGLVSGVTYTALTEDNSDDRDRTTIFVGLQRTFDFSP